MTSRSFAFLALACAILSGCQTKSAHEQKSAFSSVYTASSAYSLRAGPIKTFPNGLQRPALKKGLKYFIEFRARNAKSYGHAAVAFGRLDRRGKLPTLKNGDLKPGRIEISGLAPASDEVAVYSAGHLIPVIGSTGPSDGDDEQAYLLARFRINLTEAEFRRTVAIIKARKSKPQYWNGPLNSCVTYIHRIASEMGLKTPKTLHLPKGYVTKLKAPNS